MKVLPVDVIPLTRPVKFRWRQTVSGMDGIARTIEHEGSVLLTIEEPLVELINLVKQQQQEILGLRKQVEGMADRIAQQSELLSRAAEKNSTQQQVLKKHKG